jgi:hypothetical protein
MMEQLKEGMMDLLKKKMEKEELLLAKTVGMM